MTYPGNPSLPSEVRERVLSTFRQAVALYNQGRTEEVGSGCELIQTMDPQFEPARKLLEKVRNPSAPIDVNNLLPVEVGNSRLDEARRALEARDFQRAMDLCSEVLREDFGNEEAQFLSNEARERVEAAPFVEQFAKSARTHLSNGNRTAAKTALDKARSLDETHPQVREVARLFESAPEVATPTPPAADPFTAGFGSTTPFQPEPFPSAAPAPEASAPAFDFSSSFVVDAPPVAAPAAKTAAPASDFGFTFEEEQKPEAGFGAFAFGEPQPSTPTAGTGQPAAEPSATFDFTTASVDVSPEDQEKITRYLAEGDEAHSKSEYQKAIDLWSRIFLIDVTNEQASERIEKARAKRIEIDQRVEEMVVAATLAYEKKDYDNARKKFEEVVRLDPHNFNAVEYLEKLNERSAAAVSPLDLPEPTAHRAQSDDLFEDDFSSSPSQEILVPPAPGAKPSKLTAPATSTAATSGRTGRSPLPLFAAAAAVILLGIGGYFAYSKLFGSRQSYDPAVTQATFTQAQSLSKRGKYDQAIGLLSAIKPDDPQHDRALEMIADLKNKKSENAGMIDGRPAAQVFSDLLDAGKTAFETHDYVAAKQAFERASTIQQLPMEASTMFITASQQVAKLDSAKLLFKEGSYAQAIVDLEALQAQDPSSPNIKKMLSDAHFDLGRAALLEERLSDATSEFEKVLASNPNDEVAKKSHDLAVRYDGQTRDLLYKIYVKYLPIREVH